MQTCAYCGCGLFMAPTCQQCGAPYTPRLIGQTPPVVGRIEIDPRPGAMNEIPFNYHQAFDLAVQSGGR